jgi:uncharacterized LabA/DUF88 family protein
VIEDNNLDRAIVFIDGNNLYHRLKEQGWGTWIDVGKLAQKVVGQRTLVHIYYYNAPPPGGKRFTKKGNDFLSLVQKTPNLTFRRSWLRGIQKVDEYGTYQAYQEKGGDTALSTDLVSAAADNQFDVAIIISNDGDYAPAAHKVQDVYRKRVEVIYFEGRRPFAMESCSLMRSFRRSFIEDDYTRPNKRPKSRKRKRR